MRSEVLVLFLFMSAVTYLPRMMPLVVLSRLNMPEWLIRWLSFVPAAVLAALLAPSLLLADSGGGISLALSWGNFPLMAAIPTFLVAIWTKNLFMPVAVGLAAIFILNTVF